VTEPVTYNLLGWGVIALSALVFLALLFIAAPYGRHGRSGWGPTVGGRAAWVAMESVPALAFAAVYLLGSQRGAAVPLVLLALWQLHYLYRAFIYPFRRNASHAPMPVAIVAMGMVYNLVNAYINGRYVSHLGPLSSTGLTDPRFVAGVVIFLVGRQINMDADARLRRLRDHSDQRYSIPRGGLYRWVSCPNYLGEIIEWVGWAIACWSLAGASFVLFAFANLVPRAIAHHRWYHEHFADYPPKRKAWLPYLW
jgi:3-oxo-5-alpha-steroid 4-dehydrogenase 1